MVKNLLTAAVVAATMPAAAQQSINNDNTGQVLLFPFYNADNNTNTNGTVTNATGDSIAAKMRFNEYLSGAVVLEFNVYLGPYGAFSFGVDEVSGGGAVITVSEACTVPQLGTSNGAYGGSQVVTASGATFRSQPFVPYLFDSEAVDGISRTLMGSVEVIQMGVVDSDVDVSDCDGLVESWESGDWAASPSTDITAPLGGLKGSSYLINTDKAYSVSVPVTAIDGWTESAKHYGAGTMLPTLDQGVKTATVNGQLVDYSSKDNGSALATGALIASQSTVAEIMANPALNGATDVVLSYPTKRYHVSGTTALAPFTKVYDPTKDESSSCESVKLTSYDRTGSSATGSSSFVSATQNGIAGDVCDNLTVVQFANSSSLGVGSVSVPVGFSYVSGSAKFVADQVFPKSDNNVTITGLPVIGFAGSFIDNGDKSYAYGSSVSTFKTMTVTSGS